MSRTSLLKYHLLSVIFVSILFAINGCKKDNESQSPTPDPQSILLSFAKQHLPAEHFYSLNWKSLKPVVRNKTIIGWIVYPEKLGNEKTSYFILVQKDLPIEIISNQIIPGKDATYSFDVEQIDQSSFVIPRHVKAYTKKVENEGNSGRKKLASLCDNCPTLPDVIIVANKRKTTVYYESDTWFEQHSGDDKWYYPVYEEEFGGGGSSSGGSGGGGNIYDETDQEALEYLDPSTLPEYVLYNNLYLYTPEYYPGMDLGLPWKWWLDGADQTEDNIDASFFNLEHLKLNREEVLWALHKPTINKELRDFVLGHEMDVNALIAAKASLRHAIENLLDQPQSPQHIQIIQASYNEFSCCLVNPIDPVGYSSLLAVKVAFLKKDHPNWSDFRCYLEAQLDVIQTALDILGLIPGIGEVCDITNGIIYTIRGDGINASLSFAGAVPFAGWAATGAKWAVASVALANGKTIKLLWNSINGIIDFGSRKDLRKVLQINDGMPVQAHHIIPWAKGTDALVQAAAKAKTPFHMNEFKNGFPLHISRHMGSHPNYDIRVQNALNAIKQDLGPNPDPNMAAEALRNLTERITNAIRTQPEKRIDDVIF